MSELRRDLGQYTPDTTLDPMRLDSGLTQLGRITTTEEQRAQAIRWMLGKMQDAGVTEASAVIRWGKGDPTILIVTASVETKPAGLGSLYVVASVEERSTNGAEFDTSPAARIQRLIPEVADLNDKGMLN